MAETITITNEQQAQLRAAVDSVELMGAKESFCQNWPAAKNALQMLSKILALVPGAGIFAPPAIAIVIAAGDAAHSSKLCKG